LLPLRVRLMDPTIVCPPSSTVNVQSPDRSGAAAGAGCTGAVAGVVALTAGDGAAEAGPGFLLQAAEARLRRTAAVVVAGLMYATRVGVARQR
jgi:hypothetical protein